MRAGRYPPLKDNFSFGTSEKGVYFAPIEMRWAHPIEYRRIEAIKMSLHLIKKKTVCSHLVRKFATRVQLLQVRIVYITFSFITTYQFFLKINVRGINFSEEAFFCWNFLNFIFFSNPPPSSTYLHHSVAYLPLLAWCFLSFSFRHGGNCKITIMSRNHCRHCRMKKCVEVGMRSEGKQTLCMSFQNLIAEAKR